MLVGRDVVFWYSAISPYMADRFAALAAASTVNFECWFNRTRNEGRSWVVPPERLCFPHRFVPSVGMSGRAVGAPIAAVAVARPRLVVSFHADLAVAPSALWSLPGGRLAYYVERTFETWTPRTATKERLKRALFGRADAFLTPGRDADDYLRQYEVSDDRLFRLNHVVDVAHFGAAAERRGASAALEVRRRLGLHGVVFLYVGKVWWQKGLTTLLDAYAAVRARGLDCSLLIVGDGDERERYAEYAAAERIPNVVFHDFVQQDALPSMYALGDVFVFPTRGDPYGLVVDEAMASGLPVIASRMAGEIAERVTPANGWLVQHDSVLELTNAMTAALEARMALPAMGAASHALMEGRTVTRWVGQIEHATEHILAGP